MTFGELVVKKLNQRGRIIGTQTRKQTLNKKERLAGFMEVIKKYPDIELIGIHETEESDGELRWQAVKEFIQKSPDFDCFICMDAFWQLPRRQNKGGMGITPICVVFDKTEYQKTLKGWIYHCACSEAKAISELCIRRLNELCNGKTIKEKEDTGTYEINKGNMKVFIK